MDKSGFNRRTRPMEARPGSRTNNPIASGIGVKGAVKPNSPMPRFSTSIQQRAGANSPVPQTPPNNQASGQIAQSVEGKSKVEVGKLVLAQDKKGVVRFMGETSFSTGLWIGVELEEQLGKNDGSVQGVRYFDAKPGYGLFVRISQVKVMQEETNTTPTMESRKLPSKRASLNMKSPLSSLPMGFTGSSNRMGSTSRLSVSGRSSEYDSRPSTPQSSIHSSSTSLNRSRSATPNISSISDVAEQTRAGKVPSEEASSAAAVKQNTDKNDMEEIEEIEETNNQEKHAVEQKDNAEEERKESGEGVGDVLESIREKEARYRRPTLSMGEAVMYEGESKIVKADQTVPLAQYEELKAKVKFLEQKRAEEREVIQNAEEAMSSQAQAKRAQERLIQKVKELTAEQLKTKSELKKAQELVQSLEVTLEEEREALELITIEKEMAEEHAEGYKQEMVIMKEEMAEMEEKIKLYEGTSVGSGGGGQGEGEGEGGGEKSDSLEVAQLRAKSIRLTDALRALRDEKELEINELKQNIRDLEKEMGAGRQAVGIVEKLKAQVEQQTEVIEELKQRLEEAADSEELVLNLGERNSKLGERVKELESLAEHWQSMYEVSEEMYEGHSDEVRQLNSEINRLEWEIKQREQDIKRLNELSEEHVEIIGRFKEAVVQFQDERKQAEKRQQELQTQVESSGGATRKLGELADKAGKAMQTVRARSMELELQKNEMELCLQEIKILSSYLPESIVKNEIISVGGFLGIRRLEMLSRLICKQLEQHQQDQENYKQLSSEQVDKEYLNIAICRRVFACSAEVAELIVHNIETSSEQEFLAVGNVLNSNQQEIQSIELKVRELVRDGTLQDIGDGQGISRLNHAISVGKSLQELLVRCEKRLMAVDGENKKGSTKENSMQSVKKAVTELGYSIDQIQVGLLYFFDNFIENEELVHKSESVLGGLKDIKLLLVKLQCKVVDELFRRSNDNRKATDEIEEYRVDVDTRQLDDIVASISLLLRFSEVLVKLIDQTKSEFGDNKDNAMDTEPSAESSGYTLQLFEALFKQAADSVLLDSSSADSSVEPLSSSLQLPSNVDLCYFDEKISQVYNILGPIVTSLIEQYNNSDFTTDSNITNQLTSHTHDSERATIKVCKVVTPWKSKNLQETNNVQDLEKSALTIRSLNQQVLNLATQIKQAHHANEEYKVQIQVLQKRKRTTDSQYQETITQLKNDLETSNKLKAQFENIVEGLHAEIDSLNANKPVANIGTTSSVDMTLASPATVPNSVAGVNADSNLEPNYKTLGAYNATTNIQVNNNYIYTQSNVVDDSILAMQLKACRKNIQSLNLQVAKLKLAKLDPLSNPNRIAGDFNTGAGTFSNTLALAPSTLAASSRLSPALIKLPKLIDISSHKKIKLSS